MSASSLKLGMPPRNWFNWPPDSRPSTIPPPFRPGTLAAPFQINAAVFYAFLDWRVPVTIGAIYATTVFILNRVNRQRKQEPWSFSQRAWFRYLVITHNVLLAIFSAFTFAGLVTAVAHTWPGHRHVSFLGRQWPRLRTHNGLAGAVDALCKLHGSAGLGNAVYYDPSTHAWTSSRSGFTLSGAYHIASTSPGRLWNEGLAFWGWLFYVSKFYELLDTFIILAKGKRSSTLQTYHHTGAMACMWAGIRYMSPPIWMFCFINSGIHTLMYTYYALAAMRVRVPQGIKRTLTTMQITQFLIGFTFAALHLFVSYSVPIAIPYIVSSVVSAAASVVSSAASAVASQAPALVSAAAPGVGLTLQKILLRAAGEVGMAKKVDEASHVISSSSSVPAPTAKAEIITSIREETRWRTQYEYESCLTTQGQAFAIWLNLIYLAPLTLLFVRFFINSYSRRGPRTIKDSKYSDLGIVKAAENAMHSTKNNVEHASKVVENGISHVHEKVVDQVADKLVHKPGNDNAQYSQKRSVSPFTPSSSLPNKSEGGSGKESNQELAKFTAGSKSHKDIGRTYDQHTDSNADKTFDQHTDRDTDKTVDKDTEKTANQTTNKTTDRDTEKAADKDADKTTNKTTNKHTGKAIDKDTDKTANKPAGAGPSLERRDSTSNKHSDHKPVNANPATDEASATGARSQLMLESDSHPSKQPDGLTKQKNSTIKAAETDAIDHSDSSSPPKDEKALEQHAQSSNGKAKEKVVDSKDAIKDQTAKTIESTGTLAEAASEHIKEVRDEILSYAPSYERKDFRVKGATETGGDPATTEAAESSKTDRKDKPDKKKPNNRANADDRTHKRSNHLAQDTDQKMLNESPSTSLSAESKQTNPSKACPVPNLSAPTSPSYSRSRSSSPKRSPSPSKLPRSKIPQPRPTYRSSSPPKSFISPAITTSSMTAHFQPVVGNNPDITTETTSEGGSENGSIRPTTTPTRSTSSLRLVMNKHRGNLSLDVRDVFGDSANVNG